MVDGQSLGLGQPNCP